MFNFKHQTNKSWYFFEQDWENFLFDKNFLKRESGTLSSDNFYILRLQLLLGSLRLKLKSFSFFLGKFLLTRTSMFNNINNFNNLQYY